MKPFTLQVEELKEKLVKDINESQIPAFVLLTILKDLYNQIQEIDMQQINEYNESNSKKTKKESEK